MSPAGASSPGRSSRRTAWVVLVVGGLVFVLLAAVLVPWDWLPGGHLAHVPEREVFTSGQLARAAAYTGDRWRLSWIGLAVSLLIGCLLGLTQLGSRLVRRLPGRWWSQTILGTAVVLVIGWAVVLPIQWRGHTLAREAGLTNQGAAGWWRDQATSLGVSVVFTAIGVLILVAIARRAPRRWPAIMAGAAVVLSFVGSFGYPLVVEPLFNNFTSMPQGQLRAQIFDLAKREHVHIDDVLVADASRRTTTLNAYVSGIGSSRRVVVYDTLLDDLPREQTLVVVAHELAHAKHRDVLVGTTLGAAGAAGGVGLLALLLGSGWLRRRTGTHGAADPAVVPLVLILVSLGSLVSAPVQNTISRAVEAHADLTSLQVTQAAPAFEEMQRQLTLRSLADPTPPSWRQWWFGSHPTPMQRIGMARALERSS